MTALRLKTMIGGYEHVAPLKDGRVTSDRLVLDHVEVDPPNRGFRPMVNQLVYDVSELALVTHMLARAFDRPIVGLPVVMMRQTALGLLVCRQDSPLRDPRELAGCVLGVRAYTQTTGVWVRGILQDGFGLDLSSLSWITFEDAHVDGYRDPENTSRAGPGKVLLDMLLAGEVDAAVGVEATAHPALRTLVPDAERVEAEWARQAGVQPINHVLVVKEALATARPWLCGELYRLFEAGRARALADAEARGRQLAAPEFGLEVNRPAIELVARFAHEQGVTPSRFTADDLFQRF